jgi:phage terminase small subunit
MSTKKNQLNKPYLTAKQEAFAQALFAGMSQRAAWIEAGYSSKYAVELIDTHACNLANSDKVQLRLQELRDAAAASKISDYRERQEILAEIMRARAKDLYDEDGNLLPGSLESHAISGIEVTQFEGGPDKRAQSTRKKVKTYSKLEAIDLANKMDGTYSKQGPGGSFNIDKAVINVNIKPWDDGKPFKRIAEDGETDG